MTKNSKRSIIVSAALVIAMCLSIMAGGTYAWFTDTASTSVNKIKSGKLDARLMMLTQDAGETEASWKDAENATLYFRDANGGTDILWEPGASFALDKVKIVNNGNLAFRYEVQINGIQGDDKLLEVIDFTYKIGDDGEDTVLADWSGILLPTGASDSNLAYNTAIAEGAKVGETEAITITGTMKKEAGNDYQNLELNGIGIIVYAYQYTYEYDGTDNQYDANTLLSVTTAAGVTTYYADFETAMASVAEGSTVTFCHSTTQPMVYTTTAATTLKNVTFTAQKDVKINGLKLISESNENKLTLDTVKFSKINFTDQVVLGQVETDNGFSQCSNITFDYCTFDLSGKARKAAIYHNVNNFGFTSKTDEEKAEAEANSYLNKLTVTHCTFKNAYQGINVSKARDLDVEDCTFNDLEDYAIEIVDLAGENCALRRNTADNIEGMLEINTVGNNYTTTNTATKLTLIKNIVTNYTVYRTKEDDGSTIDISKYYIFYTNYDNVNYNSDTQTSASGYAWPGMANLANKVDGNATDVYFTIAHSHQETIAQRTW